MHARTHEWAQRRVRAAVPMLCVFVLVVVFAHVRGPMRREGEMDPLNGEVAGQIGRQGFRESSTRLVTQL